MENSTNTHQQNNNLLENKTTFLKECTQVSDYYKVPIPPEFKKFIDESKNEYLKLLNEKYGHRLQQNQQFKISLILMGWDDWDSMNLEYKAMVSNKDGTLTGIDFIFGLNNGMQD